MSTKRGGRLARVTAVGLLVGFAAFIGVRVKETLADRRALQATMDAQAKGGQKRAEISVVHATEVRYRPEIAVTGTLAPIQDAEIGFKVGGRLQAVRAKVGDRVKLGEPLALLDVAEASAQAAAAQAGVRSAEINLEMAKDNERRIEALFATGATNEAERTATLQRTALARAQLEQARAQARLASVNVASGGLAAPFAGLVTRAPGGVGKIVAPGEALFHLEDTSVLKLSATATEADARLIAVGDVVTIDGHKGKVTAVLGSLDAQTRRVPLVAEIPNDAAEPLLSGAFVRATITSGREASALRLPAGALRPGAQDEIVALEGGKAKLLRVAFSAAPDGALLVRSGVTTKDAIVLNPSPEVRDGEELGAVKTEPAQGGEPAPAPAK